ncbi:guanine nucleotide-binding protein subunit gamma 1 isoform X3 [Hevea brasiliensis]|uniref:guanine nucleotide-binding protein subunit gamma 1 isoform X3 n=1 Tax=Hevea brasiliensis TaxID=3981 RepID=UPI0025DBC476|nr:guanine nucleotide-binding protein subunit gamma 1 isoform X3 [Hevea brasiliensis]
MESETASSADEQVVGAAPPLGADTRGKHRILAELKRVEQEIKFLEGELGELEKTDNVSTACEDFVGAPQINAECPCHTRSVTLRNKWPCKPIMGSMV